jgi:hypothetical protein
LQANPANAPAARRHGCDHTLEKGERVDTASLPPLAGLFRPQQGLVSSFRL